MINFDKDRVNEVLRKNGFGEIESIVSGGRDGAFSTVFVLTPESGEPEKVLKLYNRETGSKQIVRDEFEAMKTVFEISDAFPEPYKCFEIKDCKNPRFGEITETLYGIVMEKLEPVAFNSAPSDKDVLIFLKDLLEELVLLHNVSKFRHGDIKISNAMWCARRGKYTLIDFNTSDIHCNTVATITSNSLCGSKYYIDPQSINSNEPFNYSYSPRSDIYALGMTARLIMNNNGYEYTFKGEPTNDELLAAKKKLGDFKSRKYSKELCALVSKATAFERDDRFDSAQTMLDAVVALLIRMGVAVEPPAPVADAAYKEKTVLVTCESEKTPYKVKRRVDHEDMVNKDICFEGVVSETHVPEDVATATIVTNIARVKDNNTAKDSTPKDKVSDDTAFRVNKLHEHSSITRKNRIVKAIRCTDYDTALKLLEKSKDKYTNFFRGCAYLGKKDYTAAEKEFQAGKDKMSFYMLYCLNDEKSPDYAKQCLETASSMQCAPAMFFDGYSKYKSGDASVRAQGLSLIVQSAQLKYWDAFRYLTKLQRRHEVSADIVENIPTEGLTNALSYFAN